MWIWKICVPAVLMAVLVASDGGHRHGRNHNHRGGRRRGGRAQFGRQGRQENGVEDEAVPGGVDFSDCEMQDDGMCCVFKEEETTTLAKDPVLECKHKEVEKCHYTYVTEFTPAQEEVCEENFEKKCQITFKQMAVTETVQKCYRPLMKKCGNDVEGTRIKRQLAEYGNGNGQSLADAQAAEECKTFYESSCTTKYVEKQPGKFVGDTKCEKLPIELCGQGCVVEEGEEECHDKEIDTLIDVPEEVCDLNPQKTCRFQTKLVPKLKPTHECTIIPQQICTLKFSNPRQETVPYMSKWCIDPAAEPVPDQTYDESNAEGEPLGPETDTGIQSDPSTLYGAPGLGDDYSDDLNEYGNNDQFDEYSEDLANDLPPPPPPQSFEQAESSYNSPIQAAAPIGSDYGAAAPSSDYGAAAPSSDYGAAAPSLGDYEGQEARQERRRGRKFGGRRPSQRNGRRRQQSRRGRNRSFNGISRTSSRTSSRSRSGRQEDPATLYGAPAPPPPEAPALAEYGASAPLPAYGFAPQGFGDDLPSYGNRRSGSASNLVPVYVPRNGRAQFNQYHYLY